MINNKEPGQETLEPKTTKARDYHERYYLAKCVNAIKQINDTPVTIFVCGPSQESNELTKKKGDTVNELRRLGHDANSGEELVSELSKLDPGSDRPLNVYENIAAAQSELIVIYCSSPGSIGETHEFLNIPEIARKTLVFVDRAHGDGYTRGGVLEMHKRVTGLLEEYGTEDIASCRLMTKVIEWVRDYQSFKWMSQNKVV